MNILFTKRVLATWFLYIPAFLLLGSCSSSRRVVGLEEGWEILGSRKVNFVRDKDEIEVKTRHQYTALRFRVEDRDIRISDLKIIYQNGDKLEPAIDEDIKAGESSRTIELARDGRYIDMIEFKYRTTGSIFKGRANVLVIGKRYEYDRY
jgi:hypothetical protein